MLLLLLQDVRDDLKKIGYGHVAIDPIQVLSYGEFLKKYATESFKHQQMKVRLAALSATPPPPPPAPKIIVYV